MTNFKKTLLGAAAAMALAVPAANAALINVGGVVWDPDWTDGATPPIEQDFIARQDFTQWYSATSDTVGSLGSYSSAVTIGTVLSGQDGTPGASSYFLSGAGEFYQINDPTRNVIQSSTTGGGANSFCPGCELTYAFGGLGLNKNNTFDLTSAWARVYVDSTPNFQVPVTGTAPGLAANALDGGLWLDLKFTDLQFTSLASGIASGFVVATFEIVGGLAQNNFDPQLASYNASAYFGTNPVTINLGAKYSGGGNGSVLANTIPEPASLALVGIGLLPASALKPDSQPF